MMHEALESEGVRLLALIFPEELLCVHAVIEAVKIHSDYSLVISHQRRWDAIAPVRKQLSGPGKCKQIESGSTYW